MTSFKMRRKRKIKNPRNRIFRIIGLLLIIGGLALLGHYGIKKYLVHYQQEQLRKEYDSFYEGKHEGKHEGADGGIPANGETARPVKSVTITGQLPMWLTIPAIDVSLGVLYGDVYDKSLLNRGPVHFSGYHEHDLPSTNPSNVSIAGHRGYQWGFFTHVDKLEKGDEIILHIGGYKFTYRVEYIKVLDEHDWSLITDPVDYPALTLQTCTFHDQSLRLFVRAALDHVLYEYPGHAQ